MVPLPGPSPFGNGLYMGSTAQTAAQANGGWMGDPRSQDGSMGSLNSMYSQNPAAAPLQPMPLEVPVGFTGTEAMMPPIITTGEVPVVPGATYSSEQLARAPSKRGASLPCNDLFHVQGKELSSISAKRVSLSSGTILCSPGLLETACPLCPYKRQLGTTRCIW